MTSSFLNKLSSSAISPFHSNDLKLVICDANVLYNSILRDLLIRLSIKDLFHARWTEEILMEWSSNLLINNKNMTREKIDNLINLMNKYVPKAMIKEKKYLDLIPIVDSLLPDRHDAHVVAAAIASKANLIVTYNLKDFPKKILDNYQIEAQHPDDFLTILLKNNPKVFFSCVEDAVASLKSIPSINSYLISLENDYLVNTANHIRRISNNFNINHYAMRSFKFDLTFI